MNLENLLIPTDNEPKTEQEREYRTILRDIILEEIKTLISDHRERILARAQERAQTLIDLGKK